MGKTMATDIEVHKRRVAYNNTLRIALQQEDTRLWDKCDSFDLDAELGLAFDEIAPTAMVKLTGKLQPTPNLGMDYSRRWLSSEPYVWAHAWDKFDQTKVLTNVNSSLIRSAKAAANRTKDLSIAKAFFADVPRGMDKPGDDGYASFPASQVVGVNVGHADWDPVTKAGGSATGMNMAKLKLALVTMVGNEAPNDPVFCGITAAQLGNLLFDDQFTNKDWILGQFNERGEVKFLNWTFVNYQGLEVDASGYRRVPVWMKSGMRRAVVKDLETKLDQRSDLNYAWQAWAGLDIGAARADDKLVVEIKCAEA
jgi:hypothetical protein